MHTAPMILFGRMFSNIEERLLSCFLVNKKNGYTIANSSYCGYNLKRLSLGFTYG
jgi:hypothetical protein